MANSGFNIFIALCICTAVSAFAAYPRPNWMQMERIEPAKETQPDVSKSEKRVVRVLLKDMLRRMSQSLESPQTSPSPKKQLKFSPGLSRDELKNLINVPEEVHQKWEQFKQTYGTIFVFYLYQIVYICLLLFYLFYSKGVQVCSR